MRRYMYGHIIKKLEVSKIGNRNQLYYLDQDQMKFVEEELKKVLDLDIYDIVKNNNSIEVVLKDGAIQKDFKSLIEEINSVHQMDRYGFIYKDDTEVLDNVSYFEQPIFGNRSYLISDELYLNNYNVNIQVCSFLKDCDNYGDGSDMFISYLLTKLVRKAVNNKLCNAVVFSTD